MSRLAVRIRSNSTYAVLSQAVRILGNLLLFIGVARLYGVEAFGQFTAAHTMATLFLLAADFGFDTLLPTRLARAGTDCTGLLARYFTLKLILAGAATASMLVVSLVAELSAETALLVRIFSLYVLLGSLANFGFAVFKGREEFHHEAWISFAGNATLLALLLGFGVFAVPLPVVALAFVVVRLGMVALALHRVRALVGAGVLRLRMDGTRTLLRGVAVFGVHFLFGNLFFQLDTILLTFLRTEREVGIYQGAFKIAVLALIVPDIVVTSTLPALSRLHAENIERWREGGRLVGKLLLLAALPISVILFIAPEQIVTVVYGHGGFEQAAVILRIFAATVFIRFVVDAYALMLTTSDRQAVRMWVVLGGTAVNLVLNLAVIPRFGAPGAAAVSLVTNALVGVAYVVTSGMPYGRWLLETRTLGMVALALGGMLLSLSVGGMPLWVAMSMVGGGLTFVIYKWGLTEGERSLLLGGRIRGDV